MAIKKNAPERLNGVALKACRVIGKGLYWMGIKEVDGDYVVVEVNDNPSIYTGYEDLRDKDLYEKSSPTCLSSAGSVRFDTYLFRLPQSHKG